MAPVHGKNTAVLVDGRNLSHYFSDSTTTVPVDQHESTTYGKNSKTYEPGLDDGTMSVEGLWEGLEDPIEDILEAAMTTAALVLIAPGGLVDAGRCRIAEVHEASYEVNNPVADLVTISAEFQVDGGIGFGLVLDTGDVTATGNAASRDNAVSSAFGGVGQVHVTGTNTLDDALTVKIQHSADNSSWADLITFTNVAAGAEGAQRAVVTGTVNRYLRATYTTSAGSGTAAVTVAFARHGR